MEKPSEKMSISHSWRWICPHYECWSIGIMFDYTGTCCCLLRWCWFLHVLHTRRIIENGQKKSEYLLSAGECLTTCFLHRQRKMRTNENHCGRAHCLDTECIHMHILFSAADLHTRIFATISLYSFIFCESAWKKYIQQSERTKWMNECCGRAREREREQKNHSRIRVFDPIYDAIRLRCVYIFFLFSPLQFSQSLIHSTARLLFIRSIVRLCAWLFLFIFVFD